jgi:Pyruvate/2-oxoacid:ferredoxin oxidoreductase delta subunit
MARAVLIWSRCLGCMGCRAAEECPSRAITRLDGEPIIQASYCHGCGVCVEECIGRAIRLW